MGSRVTGNSLNFFEEMQRLQRVDINRLKSPTEPHVQLAIVSNVLDYDIRRGTVAKLDLNSNISTLNFSNIPSSAFAFSWTMVFVPDGTARTITWPSAVEWAGGSAPTMTSTSGEDDIITFLTVDGGATIYAMTAGQAFA